MGPVPISPESLSRAILGGAWAALVDELFHFGRMRVSIGHLGTAIFRPHVTMPRRASTVPPPVSGSHSVHWHHGEGHAAPRCFRIESAIRPTLDATDQILSGSSSDECHLLSVILRRSLITSWAWLLPTIYLVYWASIGPTTSEPGAFTQ